MDRAFNVGILLTIAMGTSISVAQTWMKTEKSDPLRGTQFVQYSVEGKYLTPPRNAPADATPAIIVRCVPGSSHKRGMGWHSYGKFLEGYIFVGGVVDTRVASDSVNLKANVEFRLDDGKLQSELWRHSTDFSSLFFDSGDLNNLLFGHIMYHKEDTNPQVRKVVLGVPEFLGGEIVMQFNMPDASEVGDACDVIWHK